MTEREAMRATMTTAPDFDFDFSELSLLSRFASPDWRPNMLIVCPETMRESATKQVAMWCPPPVHVCRLPGPLDLPPACGTLVLSDVAEMEVPQQLTLYDWMSKNQGTRVISITSADLPGLIRDARFLEGLYYRLNTVRVDAQDSRSSRRTWPPRGKICLW
jgi:hypothetical protein